MVDKNQKTQGIAAAKLKTDEFKVLREKVDSIQRNVDRIDRDLAEDRKYMHEFVIRLGNVENGISQLLRGQQTTTNRIKDAVEDIIEPAAEEVSKEAKSLKEIIKSKKFIAIRPKFRFFFWRR